MRVPERGEDLGGVEGAARVQGPSRNTRDPSAPPSSRLGGGNRPKAKAAIAQRKSDGVIVPTRAATNNAAGGKGHERGHVGDEGKRKGMTGDKTRRVELCDGKQGFDFLGCHLRKRLGGAIWERERKRVYFLHRQPSRRAMKRIRQRVREATPRGRCHADLRVVVAELNPILRGGGAYFRTGNAARSFNQIDTYVYERLRGLRVKRAGRQLQASKASTWTRDYVHNLGLHRLRGAVTCPEATQYRWHESPPASRVREIRTHGFYGGRMETRRQDEGK
jgi:group II intron maturase